MEEINNGAIFICSDESIHEISGGNVKRQKMTRPKGVPSEEYATHAAPVKFTQMYWGCHSTEPTLVIGSQYLFESLTPEQKHVKDVECEVRNLLAREEVDKKRQLAEIPDTEEYETLQVYQKTEFCTAIINNSKTVNKAIKRHNDRLKEIGQMGPHGKGRKMPKKPDQIWRYPEAEYVTREISGLHYKENVISLLYKFAEEVMKRNPEKKVYVIEDNAPAHVKAARLCEEDHIARGINKTKWIANSPDLHAIESLWWPSKVRLKPKWNEIQSAGKKAKEDAREAISQDWLSRANQAIAERVCKGWKAKLMLCSARGGRNNFRG